MWQLCFENIMSVIADILNKIKKYCFTSFFTKQKTDDVVPFPNQSISSIMSSVSPINSTAYISMISRSNEYEIVYCII